MPARESVIFYPGQLDFRMLFEPVWISSLEHLAAFDNIFHATSWLRRLFIAYQIPEGFPHIVLPQRLWNRPTIPIIMFSQGQMLIKDQELDFWAQDWSFSYNGGFTRENLITEWDFTIAAEEILAIEPSPYQSPLMSFYQIPFTRILTSHKDKLLRDFLVCVGGEGIFLGKIRKESEELARALQVLIRPKTRRRTGLDAHPDSSDDV
jgi:hypothetical protein